MAEHVQRELDEMVGPLMDLQERDIFNTSEIKAILKRRREYEYKLRARNPMKSDFLSYISDEMNFEKLRQLRTKRVIKIQKRKEEAEERRQAEEEGIEDSSTKNDTKKKKSNKKHHNIGDGHVVRHIHRLFTRTLRKYKDDLTLYLQYVDFCKTVSANNDKRVSQIYAQALQLHPHSTVLWLEASSHEYFANGSIANARILLQRAIRTVSRDSKQCQELWIQLFTLELHFVQKMKGRKNILLHGGEEQQEEEAEDAAKKKNGSDDDDDQDNDDDYALAKLVYDHAIKKRQQDTTTKSSSSATTTATTAATQNKNDIEFRYKFITQLQMFPHTEQLEEYIMKTIVQDYAHTSPDAWIVMANYELEQQQREVNFQQQQSPQDDDIDEDEPKSKRPRLDHDDEGNNRSSNDDDNDDKYKSVLNILNRAITTIPTCEMYLKVIEFVKQHIVMTAGGDDDVVATSFLDDLFDNIISSSTTTATINSSAALVLEYANHLVAAAQRHGRDDEDEEDGNDDGRDLNNAIQVLEEYIQQRTDGSHDCDDVLIWLQLACLVDYDQKQQQQSPNTRQAKSASIRILERALRCIPMKEDGHFIVLLQLLGCHLNSTDEDEQDAKADDDSDNDTEEKKGEGGRTNVKSDHVLKILERMLVLYPGFASDDNGKVTLEEVCSRMQQQQQEEEDAAPIFISNNNNGNAIIISSVAQSCLGCLRYMFHKHGLNGARETYRKILYQSNFVQQPDDVQDLRLFIDEAIKIEEDAASFMSLLLGEQQQKQQLHQLPLFKLYDIAIHTFKGLSLSNLAADYRQRRDEQTLLHQQRAHRRPIISLSSGRAPTFDVTSPDFNPTTIIQAYEIFQVVHLRNATTKKGVATSDNITWKDIGTIFEQLNVEDRESWCIETKGGGDDDDITPADFLEPTKSKSTKGYCSFLIQKDSSTLEEVLNRLPVSNFSSVLGECCYESYDNEPALWMFFGRNPRSNSTSNMVGRPEHTDSVPYHDGTWHYQLSGKKRWNLRPTKALLQSHLSKYLSASDKQHRQQKLNLDEDTRWSVECREGDIIVVNTKLWFHQTSIAPQKKPSVSYARDFCLSSSDNDGSLESNKEKGGGLMTNLDGLYATSDIEAGTIIFQETNMPDCELYTSKDHPNCEVVQLEDGTGAVVSIKSIASGEFFCVAESESEEEDDVIEEEEGFDDDT